MRRGHVARIQQGEDFFVALADHAEWGHAFTVWGEVSARYEGDVGEV